MDVVLREAIFILLILQAECHIGLTAVEHQYRLCAGGDFILFFTVYIIYKRVLFAVVARRHSVPAGRTAGEGLKNTVVPTGAAELLRNPAAVRILFIQPAAVFVLQADITAGERQIIQIRLLAIFIDIDLHAALDTAGVGCVDIRHAFLAGCDNAVFDRCHCLIRCRPGVGAVFIAVKGRQGQLFALENRVHAADAIGIRDLYALDPDIDIQLVFRIAFDRNCQHRRTHLLRNDINDIVRKSAVVDRDNIRFTAGKVQQLLLAQGAKVKIGLVVLWDRLAVLIQGKGIIAVVLQSIPVGSPDRYIFRNRIHPTAIRFTVIRRFDLQIALTDCIRPLGGRHRPAGRVDRGIKLVRAEAPGHAALDGLAVLRQGRRHGIRILAGDQKRRIRHTGYPSQNVLPSHSDDRLGGRLVRRQGNAGDPDAHRDQQRNDQEQPD